MNNGRKRIIGQGTTWLNEYSLGVDKLLKSCMTRGIKAHHYYGWQETNIPYGLVVQLCDAIFN
jgi:hypothetical protein